jgi:fimbrial chaperone protein
MRRSFLLFVCLVSLVDPTLAGSFHVTPVRVELSGRESSSIVQVENSGESAVTIQLKMTSWSQQEGKDKLSGTRDVIATPSIFNIKAGATQLVRIGMLRKSEQFKELSYRLFLEEIPPPPAPEFKGLQVALRISIPVFVQPDQEARQQLHFSVIKKPDEKKQLLVSNSGMAHSQIFNVKIFSASKPDQILGTVDASMYVLPGQERSIPLDSTDIFQKDVEPLIIKAQTRAGPVESHATISTQN